MSGIQFQIADRPPPVGEYRTLGNPYFAIRMLKRPRWLTRMMVRLCFELHWHDHAQAPKR